MVRMLWSSLRTVRELKNWLTGRSLPGYGAWFPVDGVAAVEVAEARVGGVDAPEEGETHAGGLDGTEEQEPPERPDRTASRSVTGRAGGS